MVWEALPFEWKAGAMSAGLLAEDAVVNAADRDS